VRYNKGNTSRLISEGDITMGDNISAILTLCGLGLAGCAVLFIGVLAVLFLTGRWLMIPTVLAIVPQAFRYVFGRGGLLRGTGSGASKTSRYNVDSDGDFERTRERSASAADRIRARRNQFDAPLSEDLSPDRRPFEQGGQRGGIGDRYEIPPPQRKSPGPDAGEIGNRPTRDSRRREGNEDEIFGGMFDE
jgi:hypothetical protein